MVLAVAALLFQVSAVPYSMPAQFAQADSGVAADPDTSAMATAYVAAPDTTNVQKRPNLDNVKLGDQPAFAKESTSDKSSSASPLKTVAYNTPDSSISSVRVPEINPGKPQEIKVAETYPARRSWVALSILQHGAAGFDAYSTRYAVGHGAVEDDPFLRPFAHSPSIYVVSQLCPLALDLVGRKMQRSQNDFIRRMWWLPQTASTGMYLFSGVHNMHVGAHAIQ
jgi:hypothetical protein